MMLFIFNILFIIFGIYYNKTIIFPFKKISIEDFNETRTINDLFSYNIYTNISMGTPPQTVAHLFIQESFPFIYGGIHLSYNPDKYKKFEKIIENLTYFLYDKENSSTYKCHDDFHFISSDEFYFQNLNKTETKINLKFNEHSSQSKYTCGIIGLQHPFFPDYDTEIYFINEIKNLDLISDYYITILFNDKNNLFNYNNNSYLGTIIIGESLHQFNPDKFKKEDEEIINGDDFSLFINEIKFFSPKYNFSEENRQIKISLTSGFIKGTNSYRNEIEKIFFSELIKNKLCFVENLDDNIYISQRITYSCLNNQEVQEQIKSFPTLYFEIKSNNLTFMFTYKDLFKSFNDRLYFLVSFINYNTSDWTMGELFLRKYLASFNYDSKTISFYRNQVDEINYKSQIPDVPNNTNKEENSSNLNIGKIIRIIIEILMGITIIVILIVLIKKYKNSRKKHANELDDDDYDYIPKEKKEPILTENNSENKIIN